MEIRWPTTPPEQHARPAVLLVEDIFLTRGTFRSVRDPEGSRWYAQWRAPKDPEEAARLEETILNMCYARYPLENENA